MEWIRTLRACKSTQASIHNFKNLLRNGPVFKAYWQTLKQIPYLWDLQRKYFLAASFNKSQPCELNPKLHSRPNFSRLACSLYKAKKQNWNFCGNITPPASLLGEPAKIIMFEEKRIKKLLPYHYNTPPQPPKPRPRSCLTQAYWCWIDFSSLFYLLSLVESKYRRYCKTKNHTTKVIRLLVYFH